MDARRHHGPLQSIDDFGFTPVEAPEPASALGAVRMEELSWTMATG